MDEIIQTAQHIGIVIAEILLGIYFCRQYIEKYKKEYQLTIAEGVICQNAKDIEIEQKMNFYKELLKADRILLFEFHNGQHYSNYRSALKMSPSYEVFRAGHNSIREKCSNLPIAIMPKLIADIVQEGVSYCQDIEAIKHEMGNSYAFKKSLGINAFYDKAIKDANGNIVGFVAVEWDNPIPDHVQLMEKHGDELEHLAWYLEEAVKDLTSQDKDLKNKKKITLFNIFKK